MFDTESGWRENLRSGRRNATPELDEADLPITTSLAAAWPDHEQVMRAWLATLDDETFNSRFASPQCVSGSGSLMSSTMAPSNAARHQ